MEPAARRRPPGPGLPVTCAEKTRSVPVTSRHGSRWSTARRPCGDRRRARCLVPFARRAALGGLSTAVLVGLTTVGLTAPATARTEPFRPQLVTVDTPTREDKRLLQTLGLDLTEHAGHDYIEVVLHSAEDVTALVSAGLGYDVRIPDLLAREAENNEVNAAYAAATATVPAAVGPGRLPNAGRLQRRHGGTRGRAPRPGQAVRRCRTRRSTGGRSTASRSARTCTGPTAGCPTFVMLGVHHAREWPSGENAMEFAVDLVKNYGSRPPDHRPGQPLARRRGAGGQRRRLRAVPHRRRAGRHPRGRRRRHRDASSATRATPTSARTAGSSTGRTPRTAPAGPAARRAPAATAPAPTSTATTAATGAARARRTCSPTRPTGAPRRSPSRRPRTSASWSAAGR